MNQIYTFQSAEEALAVLEGIKGIVHITDAAGTSVYEQEFTDESFQVIEVTGDTGQFFPSLRFRPFCVGQYDLHLKVEHGAPRLVGVNHTLVARYVLCGIEAMPSCFTALLSILCAVVGVILVTTIVLITRKKRKQFGSTNASA